VKFSLDAPRPSGDLKHQSYIGVLSKGDKDACEKMFLKGFKFLKASYAIP